MNSIIMDFGDNTDINDINAVYNQLKKQYPNIKITTRNASLAEQLEDEYLLALVQEREKNDNGISWSFEEILAEDGLTRADLEKMEDIELEYELPS